MDDTAETRPELPGNPGEWYLELLGVEPTPTAPIPGESAHSQSAETTFLLDRVPESASTPTRLEALGQAPPRPASEFPTENDAKDLSDWAPKGLAKQVESKRNFRWSIAITLAVIIAIVVAGIVWLPTTVEAEARDEAAAYVAVLATMGATLPEVQQTLATATEPATSAIDLLPLTAQLSRLDAAAGEVVARAARALPETLPLLSRSPLEELEPTRDRMKVLGADGTDIVARISELISYRTTLDGILVYPSLPVRADPSQINGLDVSLALVVTASSSVLDELSVDPAFDAHRLQVAAAVESFDQWRGKYLDALRRDDQDATAALINEAAALRSAVDSSLVPTLAAIRSGVSIAIVQLNDDVNETTATIPGQSAES